MSKIIKYIFFIIIIILIPISIYILYGKKEKTSLVTAQKSKESKITTVLNLGVVQFDTINPLNTKNIDIQYIDKLIFKSILTITEDFKLENQLAEEVAKIDNKNYIIKLKDSIKWHDGTEFKGNDVIYTIKKLKENQTSIYYENVKNIEEILLIDNYTVKIKLNENIDFFKYMLIFPIIKEGEYETNYRNGTGEYKINEITDKQITLLKVNTSQNKISKIIINLYDKNMELYNEFSKGNIDILYTDNIYYEEYLGKIGYNCNIKDGRVFDYLAINNQSNFLKEKNVRKAISYLIDIKSLIYNIYRNKYIQSKIPLNKNSYLHSNIEQENNQIKAKQILIEDGWKYENNLWNKENEKLAFSIVVENNNQQRVLVAREMQKQFQEIGIQIEVIEANDTVYKNCIKNKEYDLLLAGQTIPIYPNLYDYFGENNIFNFENNSINKVLKEIQNIDDKSILKEKYNDIIKVYEEEIPFIGLYFNSNIIIYSEKLRGNLAHNWFNLYYNIENWYIEN